MAPETYPKIEDDGTVRYSPEISVPFSGLASAEARVAAGRRWQGYPADFFDGGDPFAPDRVLATREWFDEAARQGAGAMRALYPVNERQDVIDGVPVDIVIPTKDAPSSNQDRVLINLHGGGFVFGARWIGLTESIPIANLGGFKVVTVDYRMGPEHLFPAASEDVAKVYGALLQEYRPEQIGIYGCSAGGFLTMQAVAWFQAHGLPRPGAIGVFCAGGQIGDNGDAAFTSSLLTGRPMPPVKSSIAAPLRVHFKDQDAHNPLASPALSPEILAHYPPALFISGTRDTTLSHTVHTHSRLVAAGVEASLHVWEGMDHAFFYSAATPEAREMYDVVVKFFERRLAEVEAHGMP